MDISEYIIPLLIVVGVITLIVVGIYFSDKNRILRQLKKIRRKAIGSVRENEYVKIVGKAKHAGEPLIAPLSKRKCVYYHVVVEKKNGKHWRTIIDDKQFEDFFINTGTEDAILNLRVQRDDTKRIHLVTDHNASSGAFNSADEDLERYLKLKGQESKGVFGFNKTIKYKESIIELNEEIAVMGIGKWKTIDKPVDGYSSSRILTLTGTKEQKLLVTDEPKAMKRVKRRL
jgi:hypothetical protein